MRETKFYKTPEILIIMLGMDVITSSLGEEDGGNEIPEDPGNNDGEWMAVDW